MPSYSNPAARTAFASRKLRPSISSGRAIRPAAAERMAKPLLVDGRNFLEPSALAAAGFTYEGMGRAVEAGRAPSVAD